MIALALFLLLAAAATGSGWLLLAGFALALITWRHA